MWSGRSSNTRLGVDAGSPTTAAKPREASCNRLSRAVERRRRLTLIELCLAERKGEVGLAGQCVADQRTPVRFADRAAERGHFDLETQGVARPYLLTESAVVDARKQQQLASIGRVVHDQHRARLSQRFDD